MALSPTTSRGSSSGTSGALTLLSTVTLGGAAVIDFTAIPQTYNDLLIVVMGRDSGANGVGEMNITFNADATTANYNSQTLWGNNGTATTANNTNNSIAKRVPDTAATASRFGYLEITIPGYTSTNWQKLAICQWGENSATVTSISNGQNTVIWLSTVAITEVTLTPVDAPSTFLANSVGRLYGRL